MSTLKLYVILGRTTVSRHRSLGARAIPFLHSAKVFAAHFSKSAKNEGENV
jgi:hypothetical protein